ncbi:NUDIX hydrolase [Bdellovibrio sp. NC01]|uniref:NUDIX domain-containing protein n=1 Tax=Bdellovibrio sp. NC01 TaxID=2220073 RepID=UPI00115C234E|nr:NUDIX hydrolase [Bdellovibrio sp. NC01]QDK38537.1 NUDIX hydrolase [Bdellovibrio sp. NC01]
MLNAYKDDKEYYDSLPRKRIGTGALIFYKNQILVVQPTYNPSWLLPGGTVEAEESPLEGLHREMKTQLNLKIEPTRLIAVDYIHNRDVKGEYVQFLFETKELNELQAQGIKLASEELKDYKFVDIEQAIGMLTASAAKRLESALISLQDGQLTTYLEDGNLPSFRAQMALL